MRECCVSRQETLRLRDQDSQIDTFLILDGAADATLAGKTQTVGPGTLISVPTRCGTRVTDAGRDLYGS